MNNEAVRRGDVWTVDLGKGVGSEQEGIKYCVIIQNDIGNNHSTTTIVIPISKVDKQVLAHVEIRGVLPQTSYVLCEQIRVVEKTRVLKWVARLSEEQMEQVDMGVKMQLSI